MLKRRRGKEMRRRIIKIITVVAVLLVLILLFVPLVGIPVFLNRHVNYKGYETEKYPLQGIYEAQDYDLEETQTYLKTSDGVKVRCSMIEADNPKGVVICLSGIVQPSITYFYGSAKWLQKKGYSSVLLEVRSHGESEGKQIGLGYTEIADVQAAVDYIKEKEEYQQLPIILQGVSMGGAIALNSFGQISEVDAVIAMSAYSSVEEEVELLLDKYHVPTVIQRIEKPLIDFSLKRMYGSKAVEELMPKKQILNANGRPVLLIACSQDAEVPVQNTERLSEVYPEAEVWIRDSWEHFIIQGCDFAKMEEDTEYCEKILGFLKEVEK